MNPLLRIQAEVETYPGIRTRCDAPFDARTGTWWLDIEQGDDVYSVEYRPGGTFGLHLGQDAGYGSRPEEAYRSEEHLVRRLHQIVGKHKIRVTSRELREVLGYTQAWVSKLLGQGQAAVSRYENREDIRVSTLTRYIKSLGGRLEIRAHFESCDLPLFQEPPRDASETAPIRWLPAGPPSSGNRLPWVDVAEEEAREGPARRMDRV